MAAQNDPLDPDWIASQDFDTSFRGYDQTQVRSYLRQVAKSVRVDQDARAEDDALAEDRSALAETLQEELHEAQAESVKLQQELEASNVSVQELKSALEEATASPAELDSAQLTQMLGAETVRVLDSARSAAADIRAKAEKEADERTTALDELQRTTNSTLTEARKKADDENAKLKASASSQAKVTIDTALAEAKKSKNDAEVAVAKMRSEAEAATLKLREGAETAASASKVAAQDVAAAVKQRGEEVARDTRLKAESEAEESRKVADQTKSDAEAEAARLRAEVAADVETARDSAREEARLMLSEAQTLREKVLEDLVNRRRTARQQIDQAKAARDRLARALLTAGKQIDYAVTELDVSIPEAKRAMDQTGSRSSGTQAQQVGDIADGLDQARSSGKQLSPERVSAGAAKKPTPSTRAPQATRSSRTDQTAPSLPNVSSSNVSSSNAGPNAGPARTTSEGASSAAASPPEPATHTQDSAPASGQAQKSQKTAESQKSKAAKSAQGPDSGQGAELDEVVDSAQDAAKAPSDDLVVDLVDDGVEAEAGDLDDIFARLRAGGKPDSEPKQEEPQQEEPKQTAVPSAAKPKQSGTKQPAKQAQAKSIKAESVQAESAQSKPDQSRQADPVEAAPAVNSDEPVEILPVFADRDIAITRFGPDLRRKLKRALADDQSDVLDRLRRSKKLSGDDLPSNGEQLSGYRQAAEQGLVGIASAGSAAIGGGAVEGAELAKVLQQLAKSIHSPLRSKVERSIAASDGDNDEVLEPVRAHYRDARSANLPGLIDDAIAEAFAVGVYVAIASGAEVVWLTDPRVESSPDCFDNTLEGSVKKPDAFPTGHRHPLGGPGCRCLVLPKDTVSS